MQIGSTLKRVVYILLGLILLLALLLLVVYYSIQPPTLSVPDQKDLVISNVSIWNPGSDINEKQTVTISNGRITAIRPTIDSDPESLCDGCYIMPGLIDAHIHTPPALAIGNQELFSLLYLKYGVTTVRDLGQFDDSLPELKDRLNQGKLVGPRMYHAGFIIDGDPIGPPGAILTMTEEEGKQIVRRQAASGVDCIKVYGNLPPQALKGVASEAKRLGLPLIGHMPNAVSFKDITNFESQHYTGIPYLNKPAPKGWAYKSQDLIDMTPEAMDSVVQVMNANNISFLPTNANGLSRLTISDPKRFPPSEGFQYLPEFWEVAWPSIVSYPETEAEIQTDLNAIPAGLSFIQLAHNGGVDVLVGTDVVMPYVIPGESLHQQLALMTQALGSSELALEAATKTNGAHIDPDQIGTIAVGAYADMLIFNQDPRGALSKIQNWNYIITDGRIHTREGIDQSVEHYRKHFRGPLYSFVLNMAYSFLAGDYEDSGVTKHSEEKIEE